MDRYKKGENMTGKVTIEVSEHTLIKLAQLSSSKNCQTFESCIECLIISLERSGKI